MTTDEVAKKLVRLNKRLSEDKTKAEATERHLPYDRPVISMATSLRTADCSLLSGDFRFFSTERRNNFLSSYPVFISVHSSSTKSGSTPYIPPSNTGHIRIQRPKDTL